VTGGHTSVDPPPVQTMPEPALWRGLAYALGAELVIALVVLAACRLVRG
jgi:hypothetical protein